MTVAQKTSSNIIALNIILEMQNDLTTEQLEKLYHVLRFFFEKAEPSGREN